MDCCMRRKTTISTEVAHAEFKITRTIHLATLKKQELEKEKKP